MADIEKSSSTQEPSTAVLKRRTFLSGLVGTAAVMGIPVPFAKNIPAGLIPAAWADDIDLWRNEKEGLTLLAERPLNGETPPHLLDDKITPAKHLFVRNNGLVPPAEELNPETWTLTIDGEVETPLTLSIADLKNNFENVTMQLQIECGGNGRRFYSPGASGNQWSFGAVGCPEWTGVRLKDVLAAAGVKPSAVYTAHYSTDSHLSGDPEKRPISRGVPLAKALEEHSLIVWQMNGEDLPVLNGYPLRLVVPGWPGSCSQKWINRIQLRDQVHDGTKMTGNAYRMPAYPVAPGTKVPKEDMKIIETLPVKSLITSPQTGIRLEQGKTLDVRGHAWAGDASVSEVSVSIDFGQTWSQASLEDPVNRYAWQHWSASLKLPQNGYYEVWARATDSNGRIQPATTPGWNPKGYLNNFQHRIAVFSI